MKSYYVESHYIEISLVNIRFSGETFSVQWKICSHYTEFGLKSIRYSGNKIFRCNAFSA